MDIADILEGWEYDPYDINVRIVKGKDGREKIQLRLDLGLLQMELDGRPDGKRPFKMESLFEYYKKLEKKSIAKFGNSEHFKLDLDDLLKLQQESLQYYHRYLCLFQLEDFDRAQRDTARNLEVIDFVVQYGENDEDVWNLVQYWPYIKMMNTRARAAQKLQKKEYDEALSIIKEGIEEIRDYYFSNEIDESEEDISEISFLENWADSIKDSRPLTSRQKLELQLERAINKQEYEEAAKIRDKLRTLRRK